MQAPSPNMSPSQASSDIPLIMKSKRQVQSATSSSQSGIIGVIRPEPKDASPSPLDFNLHGGQDSLRKSVDRMLHVPSHTDGSEIVPIENEDSGMVIPSQPKIEPRPRLMGSGSRAPSYSPITISSSPSEEPECEAQRSRLVTIDPQEPTTTDLIPSALRSQSIRRNVAFLSSIWTPDDDINLVLGFLRHGYLWSDWLRDPFLKLPGKTREQIREHLREMFPYLHGSNALAFIRGRDTYFKEPRDVQEILEWFKPFCRLRAPVHHTIVLKIVGTKDLPRVGRLENNNNHEEQGSRQ